MERMRDGSNIDMAQTLAAIAALKGKKTGSGPAVQAAEAALRRRREYLLKGKRP